MAKQRTLNEIRQSKEYQIAKHNADLQAEVAKNTESHATVALQEIKASKAPFEYSEVDKLVDKIADKLSTNVFDMVFQAVNDEMSNYYTFQDTNYLTEAGLELFEDEWFEFYHEYHGKIMYQVLQNLK